MKKHHFHAIIITYFLLSLIFITFSSFGFYHGFSEAWYASMAKNFFINHDYLYPVPYIGGGAPLTTPPLFSYFIHISFILFGISDFSARLIPVLSLLLATTSLYYITKTLYNSSIAQITAIIYLFMPWNILWFHRVMPDTLMIAFITAALYFYVKAYKNNTTMLYFGIITGLAVMVKQPSFVIIPIVLIWTYFNGKFRLSIIPYLIIGFIPLLVYLYLIGDNAVYMMFTELVKRSTPFENIHRTVGTFLIFTVPFIYYFVKQIRQESYKNIFVIWFVLYGVYAIIRTPLSHEYYSLMLTSPLAVLSAVYIHNHKIPISVIIISIPITIALLYGAGSIGYHATSDVGEFIQQYPDAQIFVEMKYMPQIAWYGNLAKYQIGDMSNQFNQTQIDNDSDNRTVLIVADDKMSVNLNKTYTKIYQTQDMSVYRRP